MSVWEYKVIPAPQKGIKARGLKNAEERFAHALELLMNEMSVDGWEFQRAETLPSQERSGLTGTTTEWRNLMVFRRAAAQPEDEFEHELLPPPSPALQFEDEQNDHIQNEKPAKQSEPGNGLEQTQAALSESANSSTPPMVEQSETKEDTTQNRSS